MSEIPSITLKRSELQSFVPADSLYPDVYVGELKDDVRAAIAAGKPVKAIKLGSEEVDFQSRLTEAAVRGLHQALMRTSDQAHILIWEGGKVPRGAHIGAHTISWTQNGVVTSGEGKMIGVYDRLMEFGGRTGREQQMIVFLLPDPGKQSPGE